MKVKLNVLERVLIVNMLPQKGSLITCRASQNTAKILLITPEEEQEFGLEREGGMTTWNDKGKQEQEFDLPPSTVKLIRDILNDLDAKEELPSNSISLCEKFLPGEADSPA